MLPPPSRRELSAARAEFHELVARRAREAEFQDLFARCPYVLSRSLPLRLEPHNIHAYARPGHSDPDFVIFPERGSALSTYGVIELKRPDTRIAVGSGRKGIVLLSRDARTAIAQAQVYGERLTKQLAVDPQRMLFLGNRAHIFVILGMSTELAAAIASEFYERQLRRELPADSYLIPYDTLLRSFEATIPREVSVLVPALESKVPEDALAMVMGDALWQWDRFDVTSESLQFWEAIERQVEAVTGRRYDPPTIVRGRFEIPDSGELATEADNPRALYVAIAELAARFTAGDTRGPGKLQRFLRGEELLRRGRGARGVDAVLLSEHEEVLREAAWRCVSTGGATVVLPRNDVVKQLEGLDLLIRDASDSDEMGYLVHRRAIYF